MFDGRLLTGPVPIFFAPDPTAARTAMAANQTGAMADIPASSQHFLVMEHLSLPDAVIYMQSKHHAAKDVPGFNALGAGRQPRPPKGSVLCLKNL